MKAFKLPLAVMVAIAFLSFMPSAMAAPMGSLDLANCGGGGVAVSATEIDWRLPVGPPNGCIITGSETSLTWSGGTLGPGVTGSILDITLAPGTVPGFMTIGGLVFDLTSLGPGVSNTVCAASYADPNAPACSIPVTVPGLGTIQSPFILAPNGTGTTVTLSAGGVVADANGTSNWMGPYTTQFSGISPAQLAAGIGGATVTTPGGSVRCVGGVCTSTYSGTFDVTMIPEPTTTMLLGSGLMLVGLLGRRLKK